MTKTKRHKQTRTVQLPERALGMITGGLAEIRNCNEKTKLPPCEHCGGEVGPAFTISAIRDGRCIDWSQARPDEFQQHWWIACDECGERPEVN